MPIEIVDDREDVRAAAHVTGLLFGLPEPPPDTPQLPAGVSLCMIVKDEEAFLDECLRSVAGVVDEICVFDTGSTDRTVEIAQAHGATVQLGAWRGDFGWARNVALGMATRRWILVLDADELLTPDSRAFVRNLREVPAHLDVAYLRIVNEVDDEAGVAEVSHALPRIFPNTPRIRYRGLIHENIALDDGAIELRSVTTPIRILHRGYTSGVVEARKKADRNYPLIRRDVEERPNDSFAWFNLASVALALRNWDEAIAAYEKVFELEERDRSFLPLAWCNLASAWYNKERDGVRALEVIEECLQRIPTYASAYFLQGDILARTGHYEEARAAFRRADELRGSAQTHFVVDDTISAWRADAYISETYEREGNHQAALEHLRSALERRPDARILRLRAAMMAEACGRSAEADEHFRRLAGDDGDPSDALRYAEFLVRRGEHKRAQSVLDAALARVGDGALGEAVALGAATVALGLGRDVDAERFLRAVLARHPAHGPVIAKLEELLRARGDDAGLVELHAAELAATPLTPDDELRRSHRLLADGDDAGALAAAGRGLIEREEPQLRYNAALAALRSGDAVAARAHLERIPFGPDDVSRTAVALRVRIFIDADERAAAADLLAAYSQAVPGIAAAHVERANLLEGLGRVDEAERVLRARANDPDVAVALATLLLRAGRVEEAGRAAEAGLRGS